MPKDTAEMLRVRARAARRGVKLSGAVGGDFTLLDAVGAIECKGPIEAIAVYLDEHHPARPTGGQVRPESMPPPAWLTMIVDYLAVLAAGGQSERTSSLRRLQLFRFAREIGCPPEGVTEDSVVAWMASHPEWSTETRRGNRAVLQRFFRWAHKSGRLPINPADDLPTIREHRGQPRPAPDYAWLHALAAADPRTTLMIRLAGEAGLRRAEVARVHTRDVMAGVGGAQLLVHGKGGKNRVVPLSNSLAAAINASSCDDWLFPDGKGGHISPMWAAELVKRALPPGFTMHTLRHRFATRAYRGSRNLRAVQVLLGHASIATTERYTAVDDDEIRAAMMSAMMGTE